LRSKGWQPGQYLGAQDAPHAALHTAANASYVRVALKDDMKGLGFSKAKEDEVTGLDVFSDLLSRLNGRSEADVEGDRQARLVVKSNMYVEQKYGPMRFVRGGLLEGDRLFEVKEEVESDDAEPEVKKEKKFKKRKAAEEEAGEEVVSTEVEESRKKKKRRKEERKQKNAVVETTSTSDTRTSASESEQNPKKKSKTSKKDKTRALVTDSADTSPLPEEPSGSAADEGEKESSKDRKERKREKKARKEEKRKLREAQDASAEGSASASSVSVSAAASGVSTPTAGTGTSTPRGSRNFVRSRFIAQKRQAVLDTKALNQVSFLLF
jgi:Pin2-interacting protein X1